MAEIHEFAHRSAIEEEASEWLIRLDGDTRPSDETLLKLKEWMGRSGAHKQELMRLARFWDNANVLTLLSIPVYNKQRPERRQRTWKAGWGFKGVLNWQSPAAIAVAFMAAILVVYSFFSTSPQGFAAKSLAGNGVYETRIGEQNTITLVDGSVIQLNTDSRVQVDYSTDHRSITLLQGEAFFQVAKNPDRPFDVIAGEGKVSAIGTAFSMRLNERAVNVIVTEGKVALSVAGENVDPSSGTGTSEEAPNTHDSGVIDDATSQHLISDMGFGTLVAGQSVQFQPRSTKSIFDDIQTLGQEQMEKQMAWRDGLLLFTGEALETVVSEINRYSTTKIEIADPAVAQIRIGGQFKVGETEAMLKVFATSFNINVQKGDDKTVYLTQKQPSSDVL